MTALPIVETEQGEIAAYIPTNLISITDGQIYLDPVLYARGFLPAIDITRSVSRIGGKAQLPAIKAEAGRMKLDFLQFLELEVFTRFGSRLRLQSTPKSGVAGCCGNSSNRNAWHRCRRNSNWPGWSPTTRGHSTLWRVRRSTSGWRDCCTRRRQGVPGWLPVGTWRGGMPSPAGCRRRGDESPA
ncbi:MAG: hypothetical protein IPK02_06855 [Candidatus Accumulibacter sp.]|uniref:ATP synthase subunit alpha n=1 Tax=Candidatus Accumulibacter affinis TaxID=2954384 RepID=A0A935W342_9PROT|nr:hypothetical protein [Candidatus Accumulibacter affinis]